METMKNLQYQRRPCDCCGSDRLEEVWSYDTRSRTKSDTYLWSVRNVICRDCGFAFVSPCPTENSLTDYYADSYRYWTGQSLDFCIDKRVTLLLKHVPNPVPNFVEVGGNVSERFASAISPLVQEYTNVEINSSCDSDLRSLRSLPRESADVIGAYFVLEHLARPTNFLQSCAYALKDNGILIVEVPNLYIYPLNPAGLGLYEHTNHFSPLSVASMAAVKGLRLLEFTYQFCSRPFGFAAVFSKAKSERDKSIISAGRGLNEYHLAKACMTDGLKLIEAYRNHLGEVRRKISDICAAGDRVVIWAANRVCDELLEGFQLPDTAIVIDSNPQKSNYLQSVPVYQPDAMKEIILIAKLIVFCSQLHTEEIINFIKNNMGRSLSPDENIVIQSIYG